MTTTFWHQSRVFSSCTFLSLSVWYPPSCWMQGCCIFMPGAAVHGVTGCSALHRLIQGRRWKLPHCGGISLVYPHNKPLANAKDFIFYLFCVAFTKNILLHSEMPSKQAWHLQSSTVFSTRFFYKHTSFLLKSTINELACLVLPFSAAPTVNFDFTSHCRAPFLTGLVNPPWNPHFISPDEIPLKPNSLRRFLWL